MAMQRAELVFCSHLTSADSLDVMAAEGFTADAVLEILPTEVVRDITAWSLEQFFKNGRKVAPSKEAIEDFWADEMEANGVEIDDDTETDSVEWAIDKLRADYVRWRAEELTTESASEIADARDADRVDAVIDTALKWSVLATQVVSHRSEQDAAEGLTEAMRRHDEPLSDKARGLTFGMKLLDDHMGGLHPGELGIIGAFSGVGKSWMTLKPLVAEWLAGRQTVLFTLENDLEMTFDRLACVLAKADYGDWQRRRCDAETVMRVRTWTEKIGDSSNRPVVLMPNPGEADPLSLIRKTLILGADSMIVDQLSHIEPVPGSRHTKRNEQVGHTVHTLSQGIKGREPVSCLLMHQIKREGHDRARKTGRHVMDDLSDSSQVEKEATWIGMLYQSEVMKATSMAQLQEVKFRRGDITTWDLSFRLSHGDIRVLREAELEEAT